MKKINVNRNFVLLILALILTLNVEKSVDIKIENLYYLKSLFFTLLITFILFEIVEIISMFNFSLQIKDMIALLICLTIIVMILHNIFEPQKIEDYLKSAILIIILTIYSLIFFKYGSY